MLCADVAVHVGFTLRVKSELLRLHNCSFEWIHSIEIGLLRQSSCDIMLLYNSVLLLLLLSVAPIYQGSPQQMFSNIAQNILAVFYAGCLS